MRVLDRTKADVVGGVRQEVSIKTRHATVKDPIEKKMIEIEEVSVRYKPTGGPVESFVAVDSASCLAGG